MNLKTIALALTTALLGTAAAAGPAAASAVDDYARYQPQTTCASQTLPGTDFLLRYLVNHYPGTGYSSTLRACTSGTSEHKDGRALDWAADAADATDRATVAAFLERAFATDKAGNPHALARRMGIMYLIWNDHIYSAYNHFEKRDYVNGGCSEPKSCSKTLRHRDHVHISLSRSGASAQTTFYRARNVPSVPVLIPGTKQLDPVDTAVVRIEVPADGRKVTTDFKLTRGTTYRVVGDGRYRFGAGTKVADAACRWERDGWVADTTTSLLVDGTSPWTTSCDGRSTHVGSYTAPRTDFAHLRVADDDPRGNEGTLVLYFLREDLSVRSVATQPEAAGNQPRPARRAGERARQLSLETATVRASAAHGVRTDRALRKGARYKVVVTGVAKSGTTRFDGNCVRYAERLRPQHTLDLFDPTADHLSLFVQGVRVELRAPATGKACDGANHRYVGRFRAVVNGRARVRIWDPYTYADNTGSLTVKLRRL